MFSVPWIKSFNIFYLMGTDGISFPLVILTSFICMLAMGASWNIDKHVKAYCILFLLLETGMIGVFLALDFFLFYVFWEVMLLPMYFLIGVWGGPRKEYAAIKFFLYTLVGSVLMLIAILMLYFNSDLRKLTDGQLIGTGVVNASLTGGTARRADFSDPPGRRSAAHIQHSGAAENRPNARFAVQFANLGSQPAMVVVPAVVHRLCNQSAGGAAAHVVARCARRSPHAHFDDPGRRAVEDGRLRHHPHLLSDLPQRRLRPDVVRLHRRRREHGLRRLRRDGTERFQTPGGL